MSESKIEKMVRLGLTSIEREIWNRVYASVYTQSSSRDRLREAVILADAAVIQLRVSQTDGIGFYSPDPARWNVEELIVTREHRDSAWRFLGALDISPKLSRWIEEGGEFDLRYEEAAISFAQAEFISLDCCDSMDRSE